MKQIIRTVLVTLVAFAPTCIAQESASSRAQAIIDGLTARSTLAPVEIQARLDVADAEVCRALGKRLTNLAEEQVERVIRALTESPNAKVRVAMLIGLTSERTEIVGVCVKALCALEFQSIVELRGSVLKVDRELFDLLARENHIKEAIRQNLFDHCSKQDDVINRDETSGHRVVALALIADLFGGPAGGKDYLDALFEILVGPKPPADWDQFVTGPNSDSDAPEVATDAEDAEEAEEETPSEISAERLAYEQRKRDYTLNQHRKDMANIIYRLIMFRDAGADQLYQVDYDTAVRSAASFWDAYANMYGETFSTWGEHLMLSISKGEGDEDKRACILVDRLLGGLEMTLPAVEGEEEAKIPVIGGDTEAAKIDFLNGLDNREFRRRKRIVQQSFREILGLPAVGSR